MKKEKITLENIKHDLNLIADTKFKIKLERHCPILICGVLLALMFGLVTRFWIGLLIFLLFVPECFLFANSYKKYRSAKIAIMQINERKDISISDEIFTHISTETIHEPRLWKMQHNGRQEIKLLTFNSGLKWRLYYKEHYAWSKEFHTSAQGLINTSIEGNEFYAVSLQKYLDIEYVYPCKFFELDSSLVLQENKDKE